MTKPCLKDADYSQTEKDERAERLITLGKKRLRITMERMSIERISRSKCRCNM